MANNDLGFSSASNGTLASYSTDTGLTSVQANTANNAYDLSLNSLTVSASATGGNIQVVTPNADVVQNRVVFSTVKEQVRAAKTLTISNTGTGPLTITALSFGDSLEKVNAVRSEDYQRAQDFKFANTVTLPITLQANESRNISIQFAPQRVASVSGSPTHLLNAENYASLTITSDDADQPTKTVNLAGLDTAGFDGRYEPSLAEIVRTFGWTTYIGTEGNFTGDKKLFGEEVYSPYWERADNSKPVEVWALASYRGLSSEVKSVLKYNAKPGSGGNSGTLYAFAGGKDESGGENQRILPKIFVNNASSTQTSSLVDFNPTTAFTLSTDGSHTDYTRNGSDQTYTWRIFAVRDAQGNVIPDTWIAGQDYGNALVGKNFDCQDEVYLLKNASPESAALDPSVGGLFTTSSKLTNNFDTTSYYAANSVKDQDGETIGFTSIQRNKNDTLTTNASYSKSLLDIDKTAGTLKVTTSAGSNAGNDNTLVNGLQTVFDGRANKFNISTRLVGPLNNLAKPLQQAGVMFGPDQDNFIKLVAIAQSNGTLGLQLYVENKGVGKTIGSIGSISNPSTVQSLELRLVTDPRSGTVTAEYQANYAGNTVSGTLASLTLQGGQLGHYFAARSKAGIIAMSKNATPVTVTFDSFAIKSGESTANRTALYRVDTGAASSYTDSFGKVWTSDTATPGVSFGPSNAVAENGGTTNPTPAIANTNDDTLYDTYRSGYIGSYKPQSDHILSYDFQIGTPGKVDLRLHFAELLWGVAGRGRDPGPGKRVFDVIVEGKTVLDNFDITAATGEPGGLTALIVPIENIQVNDGTLNIQFKGEVDYGSIAAIGVYSKT